ncbi:MAG: aminoacyl-tRNA hydrolase [Gammaproteobacteria bacterium]|nr:aminoacyl-tRNA hydrolase [Gammaproteobacteria bacterium]MDH5801995.1 aminoacyl-tRNA hydrolase [Gammaproteobacteria bacterium]
MSTIDLIVGLGNPGPQYELTRHNAGFWLVDELARQKGVLFRNESKFHADVCLLSLDGYQIRLLKPHTYMNRSGLAVAAISRFYKIPVENILVVHDELDLPPGEVRLKKGGGHGGHNGLRDIAAQLGKEFLRLRIGIGHPGNSREVADYVLGKAAKADAERIEDIIDESIRYLPQLLDGKLQIAMNHLHSIKIER